MWSRLCPLFSLLVPKCTSVNSEKSWATLRRLHSLSSLPPKFLMGTQKPILLNAAAFVGDEKLQQGNQQGKPGFSGTHSGKHPDLHPVSLPLLLSHYCNLRLTPCHAHLFVPSVSSRESTLLLCCLPACWRGQAQPEVLRAVIYSVPKCVHWVRSQQELGSAQTPDAQILDGKLCPWGAEAGHLELLWAAAGQSRLKCSLHLSASFLLPVSQGTAEAVLPLQGEAGDVHECFRRPATQGLKCSSTTSSVLGTAQSLAAESYLLPGSPSLGEGSPASSLHDSQEDLQACWSCFPPRSQLPTHTACRGRCRGLDSSQCRAGTGDSRPFSPLA